MNRAAVRSSLMKRMHAPPSAHHLLLALVGVFAAVRLPGLFGDLWLDEIWSMRMVASIGSPLDIVTALRHDNNHPLNSLWLYVVGGAAPAWSLRAFAWATGSAAVAVAAAIGRVQYRRLHPDEERGARVAALAAAFLVGGAYLLIHYASEARGYAPALFFALVAFYALLRLPEARWALVYVGTSTLALLAHPTAAVVMAGGVVLQLDAWRRADHPAIARGLLPHAPPLLALGVYDLAFLRPMTIGGAPDLGLVHALGQLAAHTLGGPVGLGAAVALPALVALTLTGVWAMARRDPGLAGAYLAMIVLAPAVGLATARFAAPFPRYFLIPTAYALLAVSYLGTRAWIRGGGARAVVATLAVLFAAGNAVHTARLWRDGRGHYREALRFIAASSPFEEITLTGDHDFRNGTVVSWYAAAVPDRRVLYLAGDDLPARGAQWYLVHRFHDDPPPPVEVVDAAGHRYRQEAVYPYAALSGWDWALFRNVDLPR